MIDALVSTYKTYLLKDCIMIYSVPDAKGEKCAARFIWRTRIFTHLLRKFMHSIIGTVQ